MSTIQTFHQLSAKCSQQTAMTYSTSFYSAIQLLDPSLRQPIYDIYGLVRYADEIVDSFHEYDKAKLLVEFKLDCFKAIEQKISLHPILHRFQICFHQYHIDKQLVEAFFESMEMDLGITKHNQYSYERYIYGSAEAVGLICLTIFCNGNATLLNQLKPAAKSLGAAFQKVNFLRDIKTDQQALHRCYFPNLDFNNINNQEKLSIEKEIQKDFNQALIGIKQLPLNCRLGVYVAYRYYYSLFKKIQSTSHQRILQKRIRIANIWKFFILTKAGIRHQLNLI